MDTFEAMFRHKRCEVCRKPPNWNLVYVDGPVVELRFNCHGTLDDGILIDTRNLTVDPIGLYREIRPFQNREEREKALLGVQRKLVAREEADRARKTQAEIDQKKVEESMERDRKRKADEREAFDRNPVSFVERMLAGKTCAVCNAQPRLRVWESEVDFSIMVEFVCHGGQIEGRKFAISELRNRPGIAMAFWDIYPFLKEKKKRDEQKKKDEKDAEMFAIAAMSDSIVANIQKRMGLSAISAMTTANFGDDDPPIRVIKKTQAPTVNGVIDSAKKLGPSQAYKAEELKPRTVSFED